MRGQVHIIDRRAANHYRLMFVPGGPDRHFIEGEDALRNFWLTDLEIPPGLTETAITELGKSGRYTIEHILVTDTTNLFLAAGHYSDANVPRTAQSSQANAISTGITAATRQAQINEDGKAEETAELTEGARYGQQD